MTDEQLERFIQEMVKTRESFDTATETFSKAIKQIKWNRVNTIIQYVLIAIVLVMFGLGIRYYLEEKQASCERSNDFRVSVQSSMVSNARAIGVALAVVTGAPDSRFQEYMDAYNEAQDTPDILDLREC